MMPFVEKRLVTLCNHLVNVAKKHMDSVLIAGSTLGWVLSSAAHLIGIKCNDSYSKDQKKFMYTQELCDAGTNIILFLVGTLTGREIAENLVDKGQKLLNKETVEVLENRDIEGKAISSVLKELKDSGAISEDTLSNYLKHKSNIRTLAALGLGLLASNVITPIVRNNIAAYRQNRSIKKGNINPTTTVAPTVNNKPAVTSNIPNPTNYTTGTVFDTLKNNNGGMRI